MPRSAPFIVFGGNAPHPDQRGPFVGVDENVRWAEDLCRNLDARQRITDARSVPPEVGDHRGFLAGIAQLQQDLAESRLPPSSVWEQGRPRRIVPDTRARARTSSKDAVRTCTSRVLCVRFGSAGIVCRPAEVHAVANGGRCGPSRTLQAGAGCHLIALYDGRAAYMQLHNRLREQLNTRPRAELAQMHRSGQRLRQSMLEACPSIEHRRAPHCRRGSRAWHRRSRLRHTTRMHSTPRCSYCVTARPRQCLSRCSSAACWYGPH